MFALLLVAGALGLNNFAVSGAIGLLGADRGGWADEATLHTALFDRLDNLIARANAT